MNWAIAVVIVIFVMSSGATSVPERLLRGVEEWPIDGTKGLLVGVILAEDTQYAPGYSSSAFRHVTVGMTRSDVEALIGPPQNEWPIYEHTVREGVSARWSYSPGDTNFRCRVLLFRNGVVSERHTEFYVD